MAPRSNRNQQLPTPPASPLLVTDHVLHKFLVRNQANPYLDQTFTHPPIEYNTDIPLTALNSIRTIAWNPTGHLIATGSQDRTLRIWNPEKPQVKNSTELRGHTGAIERVAWNPTKEAELASVSTDGTVRFWDVRSKGCIKEVQLGAKGLSLSWSSDGSLVMVGRGGKAVCSFCVHLSYHAQR
jgi:WD40 repeat protein